MCTKCFPHEYSGPVASTDAPDPSAPTLAQEITNAYFNLTNLIIRITPVGAEGTPAVLVGSHYDSTIGSKGAEAMPVPDASKQAQR